MPTPRIDEVPILGAPQPALVNHSDGQRVLHLLRARQIWEQIWRREANPKGGGDRIYTMVGKNGDRERIGLARAILGLPTDNEHRTRIVYIDGDVYNCTRPNL